MELANLILDFALKALKAMDGMRVVKAKTTLENAKKLIAVLPPYYVEDALKALFGGEEIAE